MAAVLPSIAQQLPHQLDKAIDPPTYSAEPVSAPKPIDAIAEQSKTEDAGYKYAHYLPSQADNDLRYPPLTEFEHKDPGLEALKHSNPKEFLEGSTVSHVGLGPRLDAQASLTLHPTIADSQVRHRSDRSPAD